LHPWHFPFWNAKLKTGTNSFQVKVLPQDMHIERPFKPLPVLNRSDTTFKKLPMMQPKMKVKMMVSGTIEVIN
jgi:hypothetical protein